MAIQKSFVAGGKTVCAAMASAVLQDELLSIIAQPISESFIIAARAGVEVNPKQIALRLMTFSPDKKARIVEILTEKAFLQGTTIKVSPKDFQGGMVAWNSLLAELLIWNLSDFFELLSSDLKQQAEEERDEKAQSTGI